MQRLTAAGMIVMASMWLAASGAVAQPEDGAGQVKAVRGAPAEVTAVLARARAAYAKLGTYQDVAEMSYLMKGRDTAGEDLEETHGWETPLQYARGKVRFEPMGMVVVSDGAKVWVSNEDLGQYIEVKQPPREWTSDEASAMYFMAHPAARMLMAPQAEAEPPDTLLGKDLTFTAATSGELDGMKGTWLEGTAAVLMSPGERVPVRAFFTESDGLLRQVKYDMTRVMREQYGLDPDGAPAPEQEAADADDEGPMHGPEPSRIDLAEQVFTLRGVKVDAPVDEAAFVFTPDSSWKKVTEFNWSGGPDMQVTLIHKPAPAIAAKLLDGSDFNLESLRGKVVVLDFWATWCGPCVAAIPSVQKVSEAFKDQPVAVIGINQDAGDTEKVRKFVDRTKITFPHVMDAHNEIGKSFHVRGIPCTVLIDKQGVVQDIHVGAGPNIEEELTEQINRLLKGEELRDRDEVAALAKEALEGAPAEDEVVVIESDDASAGADGAPAELTEMGAEALLAGERKRVMGNTWQMRTVDLDGDGQLERVLPDYEGRIQVINADGSLRAPIRFKGRGQSMPEAVCPARFGGKNAFVVSLATYSTNTPSERLVAVDDAGAEVWSWRSSAPGASRLACETADLDGDGESEVLVALSTFTMKKLKDGYQHANEKGWLIVLDSGGKELIRKRLKGAAEAVWVTAPRSTGDAARIMLLGGSGLETFTYQKK